MLEGAKTLSLRRLRPRSKEASETVVRLWGLGEPSSQGNQNPGCAPMQLDQPIRVTNQRRKHPAVPVVHGLKQLLERGGAHHGHG